MNDNFFCRAMVWSRVPQFSADDAPRAVERKDVKACSLRALRGRRGPNAPPIDIYIDKAIGAKESITDASSFAFFVLTLTLTASRFPKRLDPRISASPASACSAFTR